MMDEISWREMLSYDEDIINSDDDGGSDDSDGEGEDDDDEDDDTSQKLHCHISRHCLIRIGFFLVDIKD